MTIPKATRGELIAVSPDTSVLEAAKQMAELDIGAVAVIENDELIGILTERDMAVRVAAQDKQASAFVVGQVMSTPPISCTPDEEVEQVLAKMAAHHIRHMPLVEDGKTTGMLSLQALLNYSIHRLEDENTSLSYFLMADGPGG